MKSFIGMLILSSIAPSAATQVPEFHWNNQIVLSNTIELQSCKLGQQLNAFDQDGNKMTNFTNWYSESPQMVGIEHTRLGLTLDGQITYTEQKVYIGFDLNDVPYRFLVDLLPIF